MSFVFINNSLSKSFLSLVLNSLLSIFELCLVTSITGINIKLKIENIDIKLNPVAKLKIITFDNSKEYLQIFNFYL